MAMEFKLPELGENVSSADVGRILVQVGDTVEEGQPVVELETDKTVMELPAPVSGKISAIHVKEGDSISVGQLLLTIESGEGEAKSGKGSDSTKQGSSDSQTNGKESNGKESRENESKGAEKVGSAASSGGSRESAKPTAPRAPAASSPSVESASSDVPVPAGPATRRLARELGVDLSKVPGSANGGRITPEDVKAFVRTNPTQGASPAAVAPSKPSMPPLPPVRPAPISGQPDQGEHGPIERVAMSKLMQTAASNLTHAWQTIPHVTQHELVDITELEAARKIYVSRLPKDTPKITMTVLAIKAVVSALRVYPKFNASYDAEAQEIVLKRYFHIGVAVDTEHGLLVPVVRDADHKSVLELSEEVAALAARARARKLDVADMRGAGFTISNLGGICGTAFTPIINPPEVAILGISRSREECIFEDGKPTPRLMMPLSLSYDHRVINGADAARFVVKLAQLFSDPFSLLVET